MKKIITHIILVLGLLTFQRVAPQQLPKVTPQKPAATNTSFVIPTLSFPTLKIDDHRQKHLRQLSQYEKDRQEYLLREKALKDA